MNAHRRVWERHYGPIPRGYEIHHIDGNRKNNDLENLKLVTIQEHYDIHYSQGDYGACSLILTRMQIDPEEKSRVLRIKNKIKARKAVEDGTLNFLGSVPCVDENGECYFVTREEYQAGGHYSNMSAEGKRRAGVDYRCSNRSKPLRLFGKRYAHIEECIADTGISRYRLKKMPQVEWL